MSVSVLILSLNEEINLADCLRSLAWCDDIVVLDSFSTDATPEIAAKHGARLVQRKFDNYAAQRNYGLSEIEYRHPWVLMIDADERVTPELRTEIEAALAEVDPETTLFRLRRKDYLFGRWIPRSCVYPTWFGRLARLGYVRVERSVNEEYHTDGKVGQLHAHLDHYPFNKGFSAWIAKHNEYSTAEARLMLERDVEKISLSGLLSRDGPHRRRAIKAVVNTLPGRPIVIFLALYFWRGGVLEGRAGLTFCLLRSWYEYMIDCKYRELRMRQKGLPV